MTDESIFSPKKGEDDNPLRFIFIDSIGRGDNKKGPKVTASSDDRTNTLVVTAPAELMKTIEGIVKQLDNNPSAEETLFIYRLRNGTAAIRAVKGAGAVLVAAMRNGAAVCREAWQESTARGDDLAVVCAGREGAFSIDDAYCAGYLADALLTYGSADLTDGAIAALRLYRSEPDALAIFSQSAAARNVVRLGLTNDVAYCAQRNVSEVVPRLGRELYLVEETVKARRLDASPRGTAK